MPTVNILVVVCLGQKCKYNIDFIAYVYILHLNGSVCLQMYMKQATTCENKCAAY